MTTVEEFIREQPEPQRSLLWRLRQLLLTAAPGMREKIRYKIPFFDCPTWFCYLNPLKTGGVEVCFLRGFELSDDQGLLEARDRQLVKGVSLRDLAGLYEKEESLREIIQEALLLEERIGNRPARAAPVFKEKMTLTAEALIHTSEFTLQNSLPLMEAFYTLQGEGFHQGRAAYFIRLAGCDVGCHWCDVKDSWNAEKHPKVAIDAIVAEAARHPARLAVVTGGEPLMYDLTHLTAELHRVGFQTNIETSGAYPLSGAWDWVCLSPKKFKKPVAEVYERADELKIIVFNRKDFRWAEEQAARVRPGCQLLLQPEWGKSAEMLPLMIEYVKGAPRWRVSLQTHKFMDIP